MTPLESLLLELIPQRLSPVPKSDRGPTEQWAAAERHRELWRVAAECVSDVKDVAVVGRMAEQLNSDGRRACDASAHLAYLPNTDTRKEA